MSQQWQPVELLTDDSPAEPWRWAPAVGQRVRVRLSGECAGQLVDGTLARKLGFTNHLPASDGALGTVYVYTGRAAPLPGHTHAVLFDTPILVNDDVVIGDIYAAEELEPADRSLP